MYPLQPQPPGQPDVRMRGFQQRTEVGSVLELLSRRLRPLGSEFVELAAAAGRVLAVDVKAEVAVPAFARAAMDGYALHGEETFGGDTYNPVEFQVIGSAFPGRPFDGLVGLGQAVRVMTGAPLPKGADSVVQAEACEEKTTNLSTFVAVKEPVPPG